MHVSARVPGGHRAPDSIENPRRHGGERSRSNGNWADPATPPIHAVLIVHAASEAALEAACRAQRALLGRDGRRCRRVARQHAERIQTRRRSRAVRVSRRHRAAVDCRNHRRRRTHRRVHPRVPEPLPDHSADAGRARGTGPRRASCLRWPTRITRHSTLRDLGLNGSYVVYRKLQQDVAGFWQFMKREAVRSTGAEDTASHDLAGVAMRRTMAQRRAAGAGSGRRRPSGRRPRRLPVRRRRGWSGLPVRRAHPPHQPARRHQAVRDRSIPQHVGGPSSAPPGAGVRTGVVRSALS